MPSGLRESRILGLIVNSAQVRAADYRQQASQLRQMAKAERNGKLRDNLLDLAKKYDELGTPVVPFDMRRPGRMLKSG